MSYKCYNQIWDVVVGNCPYTALDPPGRKVMACMHEGVGAMCPNCLWDVDSEL